MPTPFSSELSVRLVSAGFSGCPGLAGMGSRFVSGCMGYGSRALRHYAQTYCECDLKKTCAFTCISGHHRRTLCNKTRRNERGRAPSPDKDRDSTLAETSARTHTDGQRRGQHPSPSPGPACMHAGWYIGDISSWLVLSAGSCAHPARPPVSRPRRAPTGRQGSDMYSTRHAMRYGPHRCIHLDISRIIQSATRLCLRCYLLPSIPIYCLLFMATVYRMRRHTWLCRALYNMATQV